MAYSSRSSTGSSYQRWARSGSTVTSFESVSVALLTVQLRNHDARVGEALKDNYDGAVEMSGQTYVDNMIRGLQHWVDGADKDYLAWAIMDFKLKN